MKFYKSILFLLILISCVLAEEKIIQNYNWSESPNYSELRKKIGWSDDYGFRCEDGRPISKMVSAMNNEKWEEAAFIGDTWLNKCPIDILIHGYMGITMKKLGRELKSKDHFRWTKGLMDDIAASGNGKSPQTAYEVISVSEEYDFMEIVGLNVKSQELISDGIMCDLIIANDKTGKEVLIYFNPAAHFSRLSKMFK